MSTNRSVGRSASTRGNDRPAATNKKDRSRLCAFTFADGRQCRTPRRSGHPHLCYFHAQKEAERLAAKQVGEDISRFLPAKLLTACDLSGAMARVFCAIARGDVKPKVASTLAYLSQSMLQSIPIAQHEYCEAFGSDAWRREIRACFNVPAPQPKPAPQPAPKPATPARPPAPQPTPQSKIPTLSGPTPRPQSQPNQPAASALRTNLRSESPQPQPAQTPVNCHSERSEEPAFSSNSPLATSCLSPDVPTLRRASVPTIFALATHHSPLPLPPTSAEFAQQLLAGRNSSRSEVPTRSGPGQEAGSSGSSSSSAPSPSAPSSTCSSTNQTQPTPAPTPLNSRSPLATHHSPLPQAPPGFGAPANWDVLIPPKPRRRFSRHWQLRE